jgi:hypothetical protein
MKEFRKFIWCGIAAVAIGGLAAFNVSLNSQNENVFSGVSLISVEALSGGEEGGTPACSCTKKCNDGKTYATCTGYSFCSCNSGFNSVTCDGVTASC